MSYRLVLESSSGSTREITSLTSPEFAPAHTQGTTWRVSMPYDPEIETFVTPNTDATLYYDGESESRVLFRGRPLTSRSNEKRGETVIEGQDITVDLRRDEDAVRYQNVSVDDAIADYWSRVTGWDATVKPPDPEQLVDDDVIQAAETNTDWTDIVTPGDTDPVTVQNDRLQAIQTCWTIEGEAFDRASGDASGDPGALDTYSGGDGARVDSTGDVLEWDFDVGYTIPAANFNVQVRDDDGNDGVNAFTWYVEIDGTRHDLDSSTVGTDIILSWSEVGEGFYTGSAGYDGGDIPPGTHTLGVEVDDGGASSENYRVDVVAPYDDRYSYTWDNSNDGNGGYLDGPQTKPNAAILTTQREDQTFNVTAARVTSTWADDDVSGKQSIQVSNDQGGTFVPSDGTEQNTTAVDVEFDTVGTTLETRFTFSRYGSRDTATPKTGFKGQAADTYELRYDANSLPVIDDRTVDRDHFSNLQDLHKGGGYHFVVNYDGTDPVSVESFERGSETREADWTTINRNRIYSVEGYANVVVVKGPSPGDGSPRPATTARASQAEIDRVGGEVVKTLVREDLGADDRKSLARTELKRALDEDKLTGRIDIVPEYVAPGYDYYIPAWDETLTLERVRFSEGENPQGTLEFVTDPTLAGALSGLREDLTNTQDAV